MPAIRRIVPLSFYLLPGGSPVEMGGGILQSNFLSQLIKGPGSSLFSWILIDAPPTTPVAEILALNAQVDGTLLVARAGKTPRETIEESVRNLGHDRILGIILNGVEGLEGSYSKYYAYGKPEARGKLSESKAGGLGLNNRAR
jgi:non-specific protein-tyrosine kinase